MGSVGQRESKLLVVKVEGLKTRLKIVPNHSHQGVKSSKSSNDYDDDKVTTRTTKLRG